MVRNNFSVLLHGFDPLDDTLEGKHGHKTSDTCRDEGSHRLVSCHENRVVRKAVQARHLDAVGMLPVSRPRPALLMTADPV